MVYFHLSYFTSMCYPDILSISSRVVHLFQLMKTFTQPYPMRAFVSFPLGTAPSVGLDKHTGASLLFQSHMG